MRRFEELESAPLLERDATVGELDLEVRRHVRGTKEHGDLAQRRPFLVQLEHAIDDKFGLLLLVTRPDEPGHLPTGAVRPEILREPLLGAADQRVRNIEDRLCRAIVLLECHQPRARELPRKIEDVVNVGATERVDALRVVSDDRDVLVRSTHAAENPRLHEIRILVLIDEDVVVERRDTIGERRGMLEHQRPKDEQIIIIDEVALDLAARVLGKNAQDVVGKVGKLRQLAAENVLDRNLGVDVARVDVVQRLLLRESLFLLAITEIGAGDTDAIDGIGLIHDREIAWQTRRLSEHSEQAIPGAVKGAAVHVAAQRADESLGAREHLVRGAPGEGQKKNALRLHAALEQVRHPIDERPRLARSRAGDDEQRAVAIHRRRSLLGIELCR